LPVGVSTSFATLLLKGDVSTRLKFSKIPHDVNPLDRLYKLELVLANKRGENDTN